MNKITLVVVSFIVFCYVLLNTEYIKEERIVFKFKENMKELVLAENKLPAKLKGEK